MAPRRRSPKNTRFPPNVKVDRKYDPQTGRQTAVYYYYVFPDGAREPLPADEKAAIEAAHALNQYFASEAAKVFVERAIQKRAARAGTVNQMVDEFEQHFLPEKGYSARTLEEKLYKLAEYREEWGESPVCGMATRDLAQFLNAKPTHSYIKHRDLLRDLFGFAAHQGYRDDNPAAVLMEKKAPAVKRKPHTVDGYNAIYQIAPAWLQRAMEIALTSLQRRGDLTRLHKDQVNLDRSTIKVLQKKTLKYKNPVYIEIEMGERLRAAVSACFRSGILCPYLLHYKPARLTRKAREGKPHPFCVTDGYLTKQFAKYRDEAGAYDHLAEEERPTFHSLRGLGIFLLQEAGYSDEYIMALSGHADKQMIEYYADGHKEKAPVLVKAGLK